MNPKVEQHLKALDSFKDWSNYLLVTTVAALGWVAGPEHTKILVGALKWVTGCLGASVILGICTLALIPHVAEKITEATDSFYDIKPTTHPFLTKCVPVSIRLKCVCWPQHALFIIGILIFTLTNIFREPNESHHLQQCVRHFVRRDSQNH